MDNKKNSSLQWYCDPVGQAFKKAVLDAVERHGPMIDNHTSLNSVVKRVYGVFKAYEKGHFDVSRGLALRKMKV